MNIADKIVRLCGIIFFVVGIFLLIIGIGLGLFTRSLFIAGIPLFIGIVFTLFGGAALRSLAKKAYEQDKIQKNGEHYTGKIYSYIPDESCTVNGGFMMNIKVHYFDKNGVEREAIIPTGFSKGSGEYPIGATIDIIALGTSYSWVPGSVRYERIDREEELMDDKPIDPKQLDMMAVECPNCGASFTAAKGYVSRCPYCGSSLQL